MPSCDVLALFCHEILLFIITTNLTDFWNSKILRHFLHLSNSPLHHFNGFFEFKILNSLLTVKITQKLIHRPKKTPNKWKMPRRECNNLSSSNKVWVCKIYISVHPTKSLDLIKNVSIHSFTAITFMLIALYFFPLRQSIISIVRWIEKFHSISILSAKKNFFLSSLFSLFIVHSCWYINDLYLYRIFFAVGYE